MIRKLTNYKTCQTLNSLHPFWATGRKELNLSFILKGQQTEFQLNLYM